MAVIQVDIGKNKICLKEIHMAQNHTEDHM